ncbi:MAG: ACP S-malonyltransferase [Alphaproteobacteria bacterium]
MKRSLVFPGQGAQFIGMGKAVYDSFQTAKDVFAEVDEALKQNLSDLIFNGEAADLNLTENTQPALMAVSLAVTRVFEKDFGQNIPTLFSLSAGHSLGEYSALAATGALSLSDTAKLLRIRGAAMQAAVPVGMGGMAALIGVELDVAEEIAREAATEDEPCQAANDNSPGQVVISGHALAIKRAIIIAKEKGAKRALPLSVSAPFHSAMMQPAADVMAKALEEVTFSNPSLPIVANVTADLVTDPEEIKALLVQQVTGRVRWRESVMKMQAEGIEQLVELGAGKVLNGLTRRIDKSLTAVSLETPEQIEAFVTELTA